MDQNNSNHAAVPVRAASVILAFTLLASGGVQAFAAAEAPALMSASVFSDVDPNASYYDAVVRAVDSGILSGYPDGAFHPDDSLTQGQLLTILCKVHEVDVQDVDTGTSTHWAAQSAAAAMNRRWIDSDLTALNADYLDQTVTVGQAIQEILVSYGLTRPTEAEHLKNQFADFDQFKDADYADYLVNAGYLGIFTPLEDGSAQPERELTRAEAVALLDKTANLEDLTAPAPDILENIPITYDGDCAYIFRDAVMDSLLCFTPEVLAAYGASDASILITDTAASEFGLPGSANGAYMPGTSEITLFTRGIASLYLNSLPRNAIHEMGHFVWDKLLSVEDQTTIGVLYHSTELDALSAASGRSYCRQSVEEFFAELVATVASAHSEEVYAGFPRSAEIALRFLVQDVD